MKKTYPSPSLEDQASRRHWLERRLQRAKEQAREEEAELARKNAEWPTISKDQHEQDRAYYWCTQRGFQTVQSEKEGLRVLRPTGPTMRQRFVGPLHGERLTALQRVRTLTPQEWQWLQGTKHITLSPKDPTKHQALLLEKTLGFLFHRPLKNVQRYATKVLKGYRKQYGDRNMMAEIVASGDLSPWVADPWFLTQLQDAFPVSGKGRQKTIGSEEREAIIAACKKWRPLCEALNKAFKQLWGGPEYRSEQYRKEARGQLAEKLGIPVEDVEAIEWSLKKPSGRGNKSTPTQAMFHRVAREFPGRGEKTIEKSWEDYLKGHPEESRKRRKTPTTPVAERTT